MSNENHHDDCSCWMCEEDREDRGEETAFNREQRQRNEQAVRDLAATGYKCLCTDPYAAYHTTACMARNRLAEKA
ncbi:MAG: hypothetical protein JWP34_5301 [Massilia sp.]|nr:hypothetical protein [Massilia sp.]